MKWFDAHNHLQDHRLDSVRASALAGLEQMGMGEAVVNGTKESDWDAVEALARTHSWIRPSFGLHPWHVGSRSPSWRDALLEKLDAHPRSAIGEIGLDRWIEGFDFPAQKEVFSAQWSIAKERNLPVTVHCLRAWGALEEMIREFGAPACGFLLHSYGGPAEMIGTFVEAGAYFSFSPYFLRLGKEAKRDVFRQIPADRILVETDAPDMAPPDDRNAHPLPALDGGVSLSHPANIELAYEGLAEARGVSLDELSMIVEANFTRLFGA